MAAGFTVTQRQAAKGPQLPDTVHKLHVDARNVPTCSVVLLRNGVVPFNGSDLVTMKKAIDSMASTDPRIGYPVRAAYDAFKAAKDTDNVLLRKLWEFDARACKQVLRIADRPDNRGAVSLSRD
ncbi:hypothetical protein BFJ68_g202 [Fusarium oxysporum]|uniref:Uncharacterized protein n=1 Tax=Fusarium oxysporum TaxID=5507 RepID=A0A420S8F1_FUSOX|nr:hypothetical protein BFJ68_g202 [Fusarium oxysporum]